MNLLLKLLVFLALSTLSSGAAVRGGQQQKQEPEEEADARRGLQKGTAVKRGAGRGGQAGFRAAAKGAASRARRNNPFVENNDPEIPISSNCPDPTTVQTLEGFVACNLNSNCGNVTRASGAASCCLRVFCVCINDDLDDLDLGPCL